MGVRVGVATLLKRVTIDLYKGFITTEHLGQLTNSGSHLTQSHKMETKVGFLTQMATYDAFSSLSRAIFLSTNEKLNKKASIFLRHYYEERNLQQKCICSFENRKLTLLMILKQRCEFRSTYF